MSKKGENIYKRKDNRWEARYIKGYSFDGKIIYGYCYGKTYREAKEKVNEVKAALINGQTIQRNSHRSIRGRPDRRIPRSARRRDCR